MTASEDWGGYAPDLGGLWGLGGAILQEPSKLRPQELSRAGKGGVQRAKGLKDKNDVCDLE